MRKITFWLSLILIFTIPWENLIDVEAVGTVARATGLLVVAFWVFTVVITGSFRKLRPFHVAVFIFVLWNTVSILWSVDIDKTLSSLFTYLQLIGLVLILWDLYTTPAALKAGLQAYVLGGFLSIGSVIADYLSGKKASEYARYTASGFNENDIGMILALGIPVAWHLALSEGHGMKSYVLKLMNYLYIPAAVFAILLTASRSAVLALLPVFLFMLGSFTRLKLNLRILLCSAVIGALYVLLPLVPQASIQRLATTRTEVTEGALSERLRIWREGLAVFPYHPLLGVGSGAYSSAVQVNKVAHNFVLSYLVEDGIIGLSMFSVILAMTFYYSRRQTKWNSRLWLTILMVWLVGAGSHNWERRKQTWLFFSFVVVSASVSVPRDESVTEVVR